MRDARKNIFYHHTKVDFQIAQTFLILSFENFKIFKNNFEFDLVLCKACPPISVEKVDGNADGATLRVLYAMARECEGITECSDGLERSRSSVFMNWEWWARTAVWPLFLQAVSLAILCEIVSKQWKDLADDFWTSDEKPSVFYTISLLIAFNYGWLKKKSNSQKFNVSVIKFATTCQNLITEN